MTAVEEIDVVMPTQESAAVIGDALESIHQADARAGIEIAQLVVIDDESEDDTRTVANEYAERYGWRATIESAPTDLPAARERGIAAVDADWFVFLDDDVRVEPDYLERVLEVANPGVGAVQGRKLSRSESPTDWVRRRARRGGTHATLLRHEAVADVEIPEDVIVLEDEYLRRQVEQRGWLWVFHPHARFEHDDQGRHPIGWTEGWVAGRYQLAPFHQYALNVPFSLATGRNPWPHAKRAAGWLAGRLQRRGRLDDPQEVPA